MINTATYQYGPDRRLTYKAVSQTLENTQHSSTTRYPNRYYEVETRDGQTTYRRNILVQGQVIAIYATHSDGSSDTHYLHHDHLGSISVITSPSGNVIERQSFDAWGKRRHSDWHADASDRLTYDTEHSSNRGYTGHKQADAVGLINMQARFYDPILGRFISPDTLVPNPGNGQSFNRYSYLYNNPLNATDPSGHGWDPISAIIGGVLAFAGIILDKPALTQIGLAIACAGLCETAGQAAGFGFAGGLISSGGDIQQGIISAATAGAFFGINTLPSGSFGSSQYVGKVIASGVVGGVSSEAQGGSFKEGFLSAGITSALAPQINGIGSGQTEYAPARIIASSVLGGTAAELGGGKFANGARTAAFLFTLKELPSVYEAYVGYELDPKPGGDAVQKTLTSPPVRNANNIGVQGGPVETPCFSCEGGPLSRFLNQIFGIDAVAGTHDTMQISLGTGFARDALNYPLMVPAAAFTYTAILGQPLQLLNSQQLIHLSTYTSLDRDDKRRYIYGSAAIGSR